MIKNINVWDRWVKSLVIMTFLVDRVTQVIGRDIEAKYSHFFFEGWYTVSGGLSKLKTQKNV